MSTLRQIEANRRNAQESTGPRTPQGKAVSSQNALRSGLDAESQFVAGEDRADFAELQRQYTARFQPLTPEERYHIDTLLRNEWILRRLFRAEAQLWEYYTIRSDRSEGVPLGEALVAGDEVFRRLQRRITLAERSYAKALAELDRLQLTRGPVESSLTGEPDQTSRPDRQTAFASPDLPFQARPDQPTNVAGAELGSFLHSHEGGLSGGPENHVPASVSGAPGDGASSPAIQPAKHGGGRRSSR